MTTEGQPVAYRYAVEYIDSWGEPTRDVFETRQEANERRRWLAERGRDATVRRL